MAAKPQPPRPAPAPKPQKGFSEMSRLMQARVATPVKKK